MSRRVVYYNSSEFVPTDFTSIWNTTNAGSASDTVVLPLLSGGTYSGTIYWGDGNTSVLSYANRSHTYATGGVYTITISGTIGGWRFGGLGDNRKITEITNWGSLDITTGRAFRGCVNLTFLSATDAPILSTNNMEGCFADCTSLTTEDFSGWDASNVEIFGGVGNKSGMFEAAFNFNGNTSGLVTSTATNMGKMFFQAGSFNGSVSSWNTSSVTSMRATFSSSSSFDQDISHFTVSQVTDLSLFMIGATLSTANYDALLIAWDAQGAMSYSGTVNFGGSKYTAGGAAETARTSLIAKWGAITDGGAV